ncbi:MAG: domain containing protein [Gemmatimonadetes bacterium]|nr:domain containing protein [Gemmatimonadota bacterium]
MPQLATPSRALFFPAALMAAILVGATAIACGSDSTTTPTPPTFVATMTGAGENPPKAVAGTGTATIVKTAAGYTYTITYSGVSGNLTGGHIHGPANSTTNAAVIVPFANATGAAGSGTLTGTFTSTNTPTISNDSLDVLMANGNAYVNLHTAANPGGEIRGQLSKQ